VRFRTDSFHNRSSTIHISDYKKGEMNSVRIFGENGNSYGCTHYPYTTPPFVNLKNATFVGYKAIHAMMGLKLAAEWQIGTDAKLYFDAFDSHPLAMTNTANQQASIIFGRCEPARNTDDNDGLFKSLFTLPPTGRTCNEA